MTLEQKLLREAIVASNDATRRALLLERRVEAAAQKELARDLMDKQLAHLTHYGSLLIVAAYGGFFGLWSLTRPYVEAGGVPHALAAVLMALSLAIFAAWEVGVATYRGRTLAALTSADKPHTADELARLMREIDRTVVKRWPLGFCGSVVPGAAGSGCLLLVLVHDLIGRVLAG
jgi:hypothetical protein